MCFPSGCYSNIVTETEEVESQGEMIPAPVRRIKEEMFEEAQQKTSRLIKTYI